MRTNSDSAIYESGKALCDEYHASQQRTKSESLTPLPLTPVTSLALVQGFPFAIFVGVAAAGSSRTGSVSDSIDLQHIRLSDSPTFAPGAKPLTSLPLRACVDAHLEASATSDAHSFGACTRVQQLPEAKLQTSGSRLFQRRQPHASGGSTSSATGADERNVVAMETSESDRLPSKSSSPEADALQKDRTRKACTNCDKHSELCRCVTSRGRSSDDDLTVDVETVTSEQQEAEHLLRATSSPELRRHSDSRLDAKPSLTSSSTSAIRRRSKGKLTLQSTFGSTCPSNCCSVSISVEFLQS